MLQNRTTRADVLLFSRGAGKPPDARARSKVNRSVRSGRRRQTGRSWLQALPFGETARRSCLRPLPFGETARHRLQRRFELLGVEGQGEVELAVVAGLERDLFLLDGARGRQK